MIQSTGLSDNITDKFYRRDTKVFRSFDKSKLSFKIEIIPYYVTRFESRLFEFEFVFNKTEEKRIAAIQRKLQFLEKLFK